MNLKQAHNAIKKAGVVPELGRVYNIFECGCVTLNIGLPKYLKRLKGSNRKIRHCRTHRDHGAIVGKFKLCNCGEFLIGDKLQDSKTCTECYKNTHVPKYSGDMRLLKFKNAHLKDPDRCECVHRPDCLEKYIKYQCIPCKECPDYILAPGAIVMSA